MNRRYVLPVSLPVLADETLPSLVMRHALLYGLENPLLVLLPLGLHEKTLSHLAGRQPDEPLAALLGLTVERLATLSTWAEAPRAASIGGRLIDRSFLKSGVRRSCPACLRESLHHRAFWDVAPVGTCVLHSRALAELCPRCARPVRWRGNRLDLCGNGGCWHDLRADAEPTEVLVPRYATDLAALYAAGAGASLHAIGLSFGDALQATQLLGSCVARDWAWPHSGPVSSSQPEENDRRMTAGWEAIVDWPLGFYGLLDGLRKNAPDRHVAYGLNREFGPLAALLSASTKQVWAVPLIDAFHQYLEDRGILPTKASSLQPSRQGSGVAYVTFSDGCRLLGVSPSRMTRLAARWNLCASKPSGRSGVPLPLRTGPLQELVKRKQAQMGVDEACVVLGCTAKFLKRMHARGLLSEVPPRDRFLNKLRLWRTEIEGIASRIHDSVRRAVPKGNLVPLAIGRPLGPSPEDLTEALLEGRLHARDVRPGVGLASLLLDSYEVAALKSVRPQSLSLVQVASRLKSSPASVRSWADAGYLPTIVSTLPLERGRRVTEEGLEAFRSEFMTSTEILALTGVFRNTVLERSALLGNKVAGKDAPLMLLRRSFVTPEVGESVRSHRTVEGLIGHGKTPPSKMSEAWVFRQRVASDANEYLVSKAGPAAPEHRELPFVAVVVGHRRRFGSSHIFRVNRPMRDRLNATTQGWLAFALGGFESYILVPWTDFSRHAGSGERRQIIHINADARGHVTAAPIGGVQIWLGEHKLSSN